MCLLSLMGRSINFKCGNYREKEKLFYYRGLKEYKNEKGYLLDTCLNEQDQYKSLIEYYLK